MNKFFNINNLAWGFGEKAWSIVLDAITLVLFARLLGPEVLGQYALLLLLVSFSTVLVEAGSADAIIRERENKLFESTLFWINVSFAGCYTAIVFLTADAVGSLFNFPEYRSMLVYMLPLILMGSVVVVPIARLKRDGEFHSLSKRTIVAGSVGKIAGALMALRGFGIESLIAMSLLSKISEVFLVYLSAKWRPILKLDISSLTGRKAFILYLNATKIMNYFAKRTGIIVIGQFFGPVAVGLYDLASKLMNYALKLINGVFLPIFYSDIVSRPENLDQRHKDMSFTIAFFYYPIIAYVCCNAHELIMHLFGMKWSDASGVLIVLFLTLRILAQTGIASHLLKSLGHSHQIFASFLISSSVLIVASIAGALLGKIEFVAIGYMISIVVVMFALYRYLEKSLVISRLSCVKVELHLLGIVVVLSLVVFGFFKPRLELTDPLLFVLFSAAYFAAYVFSLHVFSPKSLDRVAEFIKF